MQRPHPSEARIDRLELALRLRAYPLLRHLEPALLDWLAHLLAVLQPRLRAALELSGPLSGSLAEVMLRRRGRLFVTSTHVDLVMRLDEVALPVRLAGLDSNPGWVAALGRVVLFHYA